MPSLLVDQNRGRAGVSPAFEFNAVIGINREFEPTEWTVTCDGYLIGSRADDVGQQNPAWYREAVQRSTNHVDTEGDDGLIKTTFDGQRAWHACNIKTGTCRLARNLPLDCGQPGPQRAR